MLWFLVPGIAYSAGHNPGIASQLHSFLNGVLWSMGPEKKKGRGKNNLSGFPTSSKCQ